MTAPARAVSSSRFVVGNLFHRHQGAVGSVRHDQQLALAADEHVAEAIGEAGVEQREVGPNRSQDDDRIARLEGIVDHLPVVAIGQQVGAQEAAKWNERKPLLSCLQCRVDRRAGRIDHAQGALLERRDEPWRGTVLAERHGGGLEGANAACADEDVRLDSADGNAQQMQVADAAAHQLARGGHRYARRILGNGEQRTVRDRGGERFEAAECGVWHGPSSQCFPQLSPEPEKKAGQGVPGRL